MGYSRYASTHFGKKGEDSARSMILSSVISADELIVHIWENNFERNMMFSSIRHNLSPHCKYVKLEGS